MKQIPNPCHHSSRRRFLRTASIAGIGLASAPAILAQTQAPSLTDSVLYKFVNGTKGRFADEQCFWSLDAGKEWHSFAKEPTTPCPSGNGRVYFRLGAAPRNLDDRAAYWDFIEYAYANGTWHGNTTLVDAFCIPLTIEMGTSKVGLVASRARLFETFHREAPKEFKGCCNGEFWILSPCRAGFNAGGPHGNYFDAYVDVIWDLYAKEKQTPSGKWTGKVVNGALTFTPVGGGKALTCARKPTTQEIFLGTGVLATNPQFCAAANRHVLADPADWSNPARFYRAEPCNWYAKFFHEHAIGGKCYGFCYDDVAEQASFFSAKGDRLVVTLYWD
jgi:hypothetical protein